MSTAAVSTHGPDAPLESSTDNPAKPNLSLALFVIACAQLMIVLDGTVVNIARPHIQTDLHFSQSGLQWVVTSYALALGSLLLLGGRLGDIFGRRRMFTVGIAVFALASLLGGIAPNPTLLLAARVLQGAGAALAQPAALALVNTTFPPGKERNRAMGVYAAMSGAGAAIGLILGGVLTEIDWRWTMLINVPIGIAVAVLAPRVLVESDGHEGTLDIIGAVTATAGLFGIVYGLSNAASHSWGDTWTLVPLIVGTLLVIAFAAIESRTEHALLPTRILADRTRGTAILAMLIMGAAMFAMFFFLGLYIQQVLGYSPVKSGFAFLPFSLGIVIAAGLSQNLVTRIKPRYLSGFGGLLAAAGMWSFTQLDTHSSYATHLLPGIFVMALGMGFVFIPMTLAASHGVEAKDSGAAASALNTAQQIGGSIGLAALTTVYSHYATQRADELKAAAAAAMAKVPTSVQGTAEFKSKMQAQQAAGALDVQTFASTHGFWVASGMLLVGALLILIFITIRSDELQTDGAAPTAHVG